MPILTHLLGVVLFFAACSDNDFDTDNLTNAVAFDCSASNLRVSETTADNMQYFRVSAEWDKGDNVYEPFMDKQLVEKQDGSWVYSPIKHWPGYGSVNFFAYSPATSSGLDMFNINSKDKEVYIEYHVDTAYHKQEDFLAAANFNETENPVKLKFEHLLSAVKFQARANNAGTTYRIKEIKLNNLNSEGVITGLKEETAWKWKWYGQAKSTDYLVYQKYPFETQGTDYVPVGDLMVLPQEPINDFKITILYDIVGISDDNSSEYTLGGDFKFEQGRKYTFYLDMGRQTSSRSSAQETTSEVKWHVLNEPNE